MTSHAKFVAAQEWLRLNAYKLSYSTLREAFKRLKKLQEASVDASLGIHTGDDE
jgi:hypothetical protein